jgi:hypothetical protein
MYEIVLRDCKIAEDKIEKIKSFCNEADSELLLKMGELSAQELRSVRAVLNLLKRML